MAAARIATMSAAALVVCAQEVPRRLRIVNGCDREPLWVAHIAAGIVGPDPQDVRIEPLAHYDFSTPDNLVATRYWPKMGCNDAGGNCTIGDSGGPGEDCVRRDQGWDDYSQCAPPVDTKFEASFGVNGKPCNPMTPGGVEMQGCDYVDISLVDGFTLPVLLQIKGGECQDSNDGKRVETINCTELSLEDCPAQQYLPPANLTVSLRASNPEMDVVAGCYSPCLRLLDDKWINEDPRRAEDDAVAPYCCPTPPITPAACRTGPVVQTDYLRLIHEKCPGAYGYAYDDSMGLLRCSSASRYVVTYYCPSSPPVAPPPVEVAGGAQGFLFIP